MSRLRIEQVNHSIKGVSILEQFSLSMDSGLHVLLGANGAGKSTLLSLMSGDLEVSSGKVLIDNKDVQSYSLKNLAKKRAVLTQENPFGFPLIVKEVCGLGCIDIKHSENLIADSLAMFELNDIFERKFNEISGGEKQRVHLARIFCQQTDILFLDEPLNHLDIQHQYKVMGLLKKFSREGKLIICVLHDIQMALDFADSISILKKGKTLYQDKLIGDPDAEKRATLSSALSEAFSIDIEVDQQLHLQIRNVN